MTAPDQARRPPVAITRHPSGQLVMRSGDWQTVFPEDDLPQHLAFYRGLASRGANRAGQDGPWAEFYRPMIDAIQKAMREPPR